MTFEEGTPQEWGEETGALKEGVMPAGGGQVEGV